MYFSIYSIFSEVTEHIKHLLLPSVLPSSVLHKILKKKKKKKGKPIKENKIYWIKTKKKVIKKIFYL